MDKNVIALRLARVRESKGISAPALSHRIGRAHNYINSIETGKRSMNIEALLLICKELGISPKELFD